MISPLLLHLKEYVFISLIDFQVWCPQILLNILNVSTFGRNSALYIVIWAYKCFISVKIDVHNHVKT